MIAPDRNQIIKHQFLQEMIKTVYYSSFVKFGVLVVWFILDILSMGVVTMIKHNDIQYLNDNRSEHLEMFSILLASLIWIGITAVYKICKFLFIVVTSKMESKSDVSKSLIACSIKYRNPKLNYDIKSFKDMSKKLNKFRKNKIFMEGITTLAVCFAKISILLACCMKLEDYSVAIDDVNDVQFNNAKQYVIFFACHIVFYDIFFNDAISLCFIPNEFIVCTISIKKCIKAFLSIFAMSIVLAMPFVLITLKFSFMESHYFSNISNGTRKEQGLEVFPAIGWSLLHLFKVMFTDDYTVDYFSDSHNLFFTLYYTVTVFVLGIVIINLSIAQASEIYESIIENSKAEILQDRMYSIVLFNLFKLVECEEKVKEKAIEKAKQLKDTNLSNLTLSSGVV